MNVIRFVNIKLREIDFHANSVSSWIYQWMHRNYKNKWTNEKAWKNKRYSQNISLQIKPMNQKQPLNIKINKKEVFLWNASNYLTKIWIN